MAIASITQWLADPKRTFLYGKALYEQYGDNRVTLALIRSGSGSYHFGKLTEALKKLNEQSNLEPKPIVIADRPAAKHPTKKNPDLTSAPEQILKIRNDKNTKYARARKLFEMIRLMDSREHRLASGLELLDLMDEVNESWAAIDEWHEKGKVHEAMIAEAEKSVDDLSLAELLKESKNLPTYISKDRALLKTPLIDRKKMKISARLELNVKRLELIKKRLGAMQ